MKFCKKLSKIVLFLMLAMLLWIPSISAYAEEQITDLSKLMVTNSAIDAYAEPLEQSEIVISYEAGASVLVTGETSNGWYRVAYQDKVGFVKKTVLEEADINIAALDEEFEANEIDGKIFVEEVARTRNQITRSKIWGTIIVLLIVGIFGTGIYSTIKSEQKKKKREQNSDNGNCAQAIVETEQNLNEKKKETKLEHEEEMIEPLFFEPSEVEPLDIIDLDKQE